MMQPKHVDGLKSERRGYFQIFVDFADALLLHVNSFARVKKVFTSKKEYTIVRYKTLTSFT